MIKYNNQITELRTHGAGGRSSLVRNFTPPTWPPPVVGGIKYLIDPIEKGLRVTINFVGGMAEIDFGDGSEVLTYTDTVSYIYRPSDVPLIVTVIPKSYIGLLSTDIRTLVSWGTAGSVFRFQFTHPAPVVPNSIPKWLTDTSYMFEGCQGFNQDISVWDVSNITNMEAMFKECRSFSYDLNRWDTSKVTNMAYMFNMCSGQWNGFLKDWDVSNVTNMKGMFKESTVPSGGVICDYWDTSNVTDTSYMFNEAYNFNGDLSRWNTAKVTDMSYMFSNAVALFSYDGYPGTRHWSLADWDTGNVTNMSHMFYRCFNGVKSNISRWNTSNVTDMSYMFSNCNSLNHPTYWDTSNVTNMESMFEGVYQFKSDLSLWDVSKVTNMDKMFRGCMQFMASLDMWCVPLITEPPIDFITNGSMPSNNRPIWGTCPVVSYKRIGEQ